MRKMADGILSGRYSRVDEAGDRFQKGIKPSMLKELIGKGHEEFASMRQQGLCPSLPGFDDVHSLGSLFTPH